MPGSLVRRLVTIGLALFVIVGFLLVDSSAQKRKRKRRSSSSAPKITNPDIYQPPAGDNANANTSGDENNLNSNSNANANTAPARTGEDPEAMRKTIRTLSDQVDKLNQKIGQMEESQRSLVDLERLSRAEQRSTQLHAELREVQQKKSDLEAHLEDVEYALKPENIERATVGYGSTRPEEVREQRRKQLEGERDRTRRQLDQLAANEQRLQQAIAAADAEIDRLQKRLDTADQSAIENAKQREQSGEVPPSYPSPTPTPTP